MDLFNLLPTPGDFIGAGLIEYVVQTMKRPPPRPHRSRLDFDVDAVAGFVPSSPPPVLTGPFALWEDALAGAPMVLSLGDDDYDDLTSDRSNDAQLWRLKVSSWPILDVSSLKDLQQKQRSHLVLAWLLHFYVHSIPDLDPTSSIHIPASISVPLVAVSKELNMAPALTYADTVLWNWEPINPSLPFSIDNIRIQNIFSASEAEESFYRLSIKAEVTAAGMLRIFDEYHNLRDVTTMAARAKTARDLNHLRCLIDELKDTIISMRSEVDPHAFYWDVRPWWVGNSNKRWVMEGVSNTDRLLLDGPSAGQSSSMHALDAFLGIDHKKGGSNFMDRMRQYMPGKHRDYIAHISSCALPVRQLAQQGAGVREAYDSCVLALKKLRDSHIRIATLYVVSMSRQSPSAAAACPVAAMMEKMDRMEAKRRFNQSGPAKGTGGNELSKLLKAGRDATGKALLKTT